MKRFKKALLMPWAGGANVLAYTNKVLATSPIAYWPMAESSGSTALDASGNGRNGAYTGVTLAQPGIGDGRTAAGFDGSTSRNNIYSASLSGAFNGAEGTVAGWAQMSGAGIWTDATTRRILSMTVDGSNFLLIGRNGTNNNLQASYSAGGTSKLVNSTAVGGSTAWFHVAMTWSKAADQMMFYINGVQVGATQTGLGTWAGALAVASCCVGATNTTPTAVWSGNLAHAAFWTAALGAATIAALASI